MPKEFACPDPEELERFMLGQIPDPEAESLDRHLAQCPCCDALVDRLEVKDTLVEAVCAQETTAQEPVDPVLENLMERLGGVPLPPAGVPQGTTHASSSPGSGLGLAQGVSPNEQETQELYVFLRPPQSHDELGRLGPYQIVRLLGSGGMGVVFEAEDTRLKRKVALKVMKPALAAKESARRRFLREAEATATVASDHVVTIYQVDEDRGVPFLAMEFLEGTPLDRWLEGGAQPGLAEVLRIGREIAEGLQAAHERGLVHRDVKPSNVWLKNVGHVSNVPGSGTLETCPTGCVKLLDFGLARAVAEDTHLTQSGVVVGTPAYMAPEQARGDLVDHRSDLFSLGCLMYRLCAKRPPFAGATSMAILTALALDTPKPLGEVNPEVPPALADLVMKLLAKKPEDRPPSARAVIDALQAIEREQAATVAAGRIANPSYPAVGQISNPSLRPRWWSSALGAAVLLAVLGPLAYLFGPTVLRIATNQGELVVEIEDPDIEVAVKQNSVQVQQRSTKRRFELAAAAGRIEVFEKNGIRLLTRKFTLTRGGTTTVTVTLNELAHARQGKGKGKAPERPSPVPKSGRPRRQRAQRPVSPQKVRDADRRAAQWVLSIGGRVTIRVADNPPKEVSDTKDLPQGGFQLIQINLGDNKRVTDGGLVHLKSLLQALTNPTGLILQNTNLTDAGLAHLRGLTKLSYLALNATQVSDSGLVHLKTLTQLRELNLTYTRMTGAGIMHLKPLTNLHHLCLGGLRLSNAELVHLKSLTNLRSLTLQGSNLTDAGLMQLKPLTNLTHLNLEDTQVTDAGLAHLKMLTKLEAFYLTDNKRVTNAGLMHFVKRLTNLTALMLSNTQVNDAGMVHLKTLTQLGRLELRDTQVSDAGLMHLKSLANLENLVLEGTKVSDAGLDNLVDLPKLAYLNLERTRVSSKGFATLKAAFPRTTIRWSEPNRTVAEALLAQGGTLHVRRQGEDHDQSVKAVAQLPAEYFRLTRANLTGVQKALGELLPKLAGLNDPDFDRLEALDLSGTAVTGADLDILKPLTRLKELWLAQTKISDAGLPSLKALAGLKALSLARTQVSGDGLVHLKALPGLRRLVLDGLVIRGPELAQLNELPALTELCLGCPSLTDLGVRGVGELKALERLSLAGSAVTDKSLKHLHGLTKLQELDLIGTKVTAEGVAALRKVLSKCRIRSGQAAK